MSTPGLAGYRPRHSPLLAGSWVAGELLCFSANEARPPSLHSTAQAEAEGPGERLLVVPDVGFVRFAEIHDVHRRARLEIGMQGEFDASTADFVLRLARDCAFADLNLNRVYGWVRSTHPPTLDALAAAGFAREATLPGGMRIDGERRPREVWAALRSEAS